MRRQERDKNNSIDNLYWGTAKENKADAYRNGKVGLGEASPNVKLTEKKVRKIRKMYSTGEYTQQEIANLFSVTQPMIGCIVRRNNWKHVA